MEEDEEIDIIGNYENFISKNDQDISKISSGQILSCDYTVHPNWLNENAEGGNYWTDSVPKNENLESNVEILHSEEVVIEEPEPVPSITDLEWAGEIASHDELVFEDEIPASIEEVVTNQEEEVVPNQEEEVDPDSAFDSNDVCKWETAAFEVHPPAKNVKYIGPTNARSLLKVKIEPTTMQQPIHPRSLLKNNLKMIQRPPSKFKQTLTLNPNVLKSQQPQIVQGGKPKQSPSERDFIPPKQLAPKFKQTVKLLPRGLENGKFKMFTKKLKKARNGGGKRTTPKTKKLKKANNFYGENITISHEAEQTSGESLIPAGIVLKLSNCDADSDIEVDIESDAVLLGDAGKANQSDKLIKPLENQLRITDCPIISTSNIDPEENIDIVPFNMRFPNLSDALIAELQSTAFPIAELQINPNEISNLEKFIHAEFFEKRTTKTSEQYLRIRNHILGMWYTLKPNYVSKTAVRNGLKHGGDVNCISRIHRLLEQIGAINFGFHGKCFEYVRPLQTFISMFIQIPRSRTNSNTSSAVVQNNLDRRQRIRTNTLTYSSMDLSETDSNYTVAHMDGVILPDPPALNVNYRLRQNVRHIKTELDLVKCLKFSKDNLAPFKVSITLSTLLCFQLHSISSRFEVMGFLGGHRSKSVGRNKISLTRYKPCRTSTQSGIMCEMCPVSQVEQSSSLGLEGYELLGWFHSHPLFPANPSRTDVRTQKEMQLQFSFDNDRPFVGVIFSCLEMTFKCVYMMPKSSSTNFEENDLPYEIDVDIIKDCTNFKNDIKDVLYIVQEDCDDIGEIIQKFKSSCDSILKQFGFQNEVFFEGIF